MHYVRKGFYLMILDLVARQAFDALKRLAENGLWEKCMAAKSEEDMVHMLINLPLHHQKRFRYRFEDLAHAFFRVMKSDIACTALGEFLSQERFEQLFMACLPFRQYAQIAAETIAEEFYEFGIPCKEDIQEYLDELDADICSVITENCSVNRRPAVEDFFSYSKLFRLIALERIANIHPAVDGGNELTIRRMTSLLVKMKIPIYTDFAHKEKNCEEGRVLLSLAATA